MRKITIYILAVFISACTVDNDHKTNNIISLENVKKEIKYRTIRFVKLETKPDILLGNDISLKISGDKIFILDRDYQKCILCFDHNGSFLNSIGRKGKGAGEYLEIRDFIVKKDIVEILSSAGKISMIFRYDFNGQFIEKQNERSKIHLLLLNRSNNELSRISLGEDKSTIFKQPKGITENDEIIFLIYPHDLINFSPELIENKEHFDFESLSLEDNPVLAFCKI